eukprot:9450179-Pyramimonas_sp.AAC.1
MQITVRTWLEDNEVRPSRPPIRWRLFVGAPECYTFARLSTTSVRVCVCACVFHQTTTPRRHLWGGRTVTSATSR